jgi:hypothetical protein
MQKSFIPTAQQYGVLTALCLRVCLTHQKARHGRAAFLLESNLKCYDL